MGKSSLVLIVLFCALLGACGQILFKIGSSTAKFDFSILTNYHIILGLLLYGTATVLFIYVLKFDEVSLLYPIIATSYIWVMIFAALFLGEEVSFLNFVGALLIISGVYFTIT